MSHFAFCTLILHGTGFSLPQRCVCETWQEKVLCGEQELGLPPWGALHLKVCFASAPA